MGYVAEGIGKIVGEARAEGLEPLILDDSLELAKEAVVEEIALDLNVDRRIRLSKLRGCEVSWEELSRNLEYEVISSRPRKEVRIRLFPVSFRTV